LPIVQVREKGHLSDPTDLAFTGPEPRSQGPVGEGRQRPPTIDAHGPLHQDAQGSPPQQAVRQGSRETGDLRKRLGGHEEPLRGRLPVRRDVLVLPLSKRITWNSRPAGSSATG